MSRSPTSLQAFTTPETPIQPVATPTDQFAPAAVNRGSGGGLFSLANALSKIQPELQGIFERQDDGAKTAATLAAEADKVNKRWKNVDDFKAAVQRGDVPAAQNPWYAIRTKQLFAVDAADQARQNAFSAWQQDQTIKNSDDLPTVRSFIDKQLAPALQGLDPYEAEAAGPVVKNAANSLMQQHLLYREQQRPVEAQDAFTRNVTAIMQGIDDPTMKSFRAGDPAATTAVNGAMQSLNALQQSQLKYTDGMTVKTWMKTALTNTAVDRLNGDVFRQFYMGLTKDDGSPVDNSDAAKAQARDLDREIQERQIRQMALENQKNAQTDESNKRLGRIQMKTEFDSMLKTNPNAKLSDIDMSKVMKNADPAVAFDIAMSLTQAAANQQNFANVKDEQGRLKLVQDKIGDYMAGNLGQDGDRAFVTALSMFNGGPSTAKEIESIRNGLLREGPLVSKPESMVEMYRLWNAGELDGKWLADRFTGPNPTLAKADFLHGQGLLLQAASGPFGDNGRSTMVNAESQLEDQLTSGFMANAKRNGTLPTEDQVSREHLPAFVKMGDTFTQAFNEAKRQFGDIIAEKIKDPEFMKLGPSQKRQQLQDYVDDISDSLGGFTKDQHDEWLRKNIETVETPKVAPPVVTATLPIEQSRNRPLNRMTEQGGTIFTPEVSATAEQAATILRMNLPEAVRNAKPADPLHHPRDPQGGEMFAGSDESLYSDPLFQLAWARVAVNPNATKPTLWSTFLGKDDDYAKALNRLSGTINPEQKTSSFEEETAAIQQKLPEWESAVQSEARLLEGKIKDQKIAEKYTDLTGQIAAKGMKPTPAEVQQLNGYDSMLTRLALLRQYGGYGQGEWKDLDQNAWQRVPLFTSMDALNKEKGLVAAMKAFNLDPRNLDDMRVFRAAQSPLVTSLSEVRP